MVSPNSDLINLTFSCFFSQVFVPEGEKDDRYWARRKKNNLAAKRSRDARRIKENQIALRAAFLEKENETLRKELQKTIKENKALTQQVAEYKAKEGKDVWSANERPLPPLMLSDWIDSL